MIARRGVAILVDDRGVKLQLLHAVAHILALTIKRCKFITTERVLSTTILETLGFESAELQVAVSAVQSLDKLDII